MRMVKRQYNFCKFNFKSDELVVDPYNIVNNSGKEIDYNKLIDRFGCQKISKELLEKFEKLTG